MLYTRNMTQTATYWQPLGITASGQTTFNAPILIKCRWQNKNDVFKNTEGKDEVSSAVVYPNSQLEIRGYLALGDETANAYPLDVASAFEIKNVGSSPALDGSQELIKAWL